MSSESTISRLTPYLEEVLENTMLPGAAKKKAGKRGSLKRIKDAPNTQQFLAGGASAMVQDSMGKPWNGDYVTASGDLIGDLTHSFFLETGARAAKLKVYEAVEHPAARALTGYNGPHPETGEELEVAEELHPEGALAYDRPPNK